MKYQYYSNCVNWLEDISIDGGLSDMIDNAIDINRRTFKQYINDLELADIEKDLGYCWHPSQGLTMAGDYHVSYHRSKLHGKRAYFFKHSGIEYIFINKSL